MKELFSNSAIFIVLAIAFSGMTACSGTISNVAVANNASPAAANTQAPVSKASEYPPLPSGMAAVEMEMLDGTKSKISDRKGKVMILNLWATWCGPCREEMPHLAAMQKQYADKGLEVLSLNIGSQNDGAPESVEQIKKFAADSKIDYTLARITPDGTEQFYNYTKQHVVPQSFLVDRDGHLRGVFVGGGPKIFISIQETLDKLMAE